MSPPAIETISRAEISRQRDARFTGFSLDDDTFQQYNRTRTMRIEISLAHRTNVIKLRPRAPPIGPKWNLIKSRTNICRAVAFRVLVDAKHNFPVRLHAYKFMNIY